MKKILVVDDEQSIRFTFRMFLQKEGYLVNVAENADSAISQMESDPADIIVSDINLPGMTGVELLKTVHSISPETQVIMMTGAPTADSVSEAIRNGACDYLFKPVNKTDLLRTVATAVKIKDLEDQNRAYRQNLETMVQVRTRQLQEAVEKVKQASFETVMHLARAAEFKDENTFDHLYRMSEYTVLLAECVKYPQEKIEAIKYASMLHDIGKIGIPDSILLKPGRLDKKEFEIMKQHAAYGGKILDGSESEILKLGKIIAISHHEKWDGSGYPEGLTKEDIPLEGRIAAIADVFDALSTKRVYKDAFSLDESFRVITEGRGQHFDPQLVDLFLLNSDKVIEIRNKYQTY